MEQRVLTCRRLRRRVARFRRQAACRGSLVTSIRACGIESVRIEQQF